MENKQDYPPMDHILTSVETTEQYLSKNSILFKTLGHPATMTNVELVEHVKFDGDYKSTVLAKQLFLYDKKKKESMWLVCAAVDTTVDMKGLNKYLKVGSGNLRGGDADSLWKYLGCKQGNVNYFSMVNDKNKAVKVILDKRLYDAPFVSFHPMDNSASIAINREGIEKLKTLCGRDNKEFEILDFSTIATEEGNQVKEEKAKEVKEPKAEQGKKLSKEEKQNMKEKEKGQRKEDAHELSILFKKDVNFSKWYSEVITKAELIEYYDISGCYVLRPRSYFIWEQIQKFLDSKFSSESVQNCYFPMFVSQDALEKEKNHLEGFSPEVAWVTKSGQSELEKPIAIRPTSETIMYPTFAKWIHSHRDLPLKINQWSNVVRWEFKHPMPFIRTREFLWQEGHTAHVDEQDATKLVMNILNHYASCYEQLLAVPCVRGRKSENEKFAGAYFTTTTEIYVPVSGRGIQGATSHQLGMNFAKMFDIQFEDKEGKKKHAWQTSWGLSTRSIGAMIMVHSDDIGLVLPPRVAQVQAVIIPIVKKGDDIEKIKNQSEKIYEELKQAGIRVELDDRDNYNPGFKFNHHELRGVPVRIELGKMDFENKEVRVCKRHDGVKAQFKQENIGQQIKDLLEQIHHEMFQKALQSRLNHTKNVDNWTDFMSALSGRNICMAAWCNEKECEEKAKDRSKEESLKAMADKNEDEALLTGAAKTLCIPFDQPELKAGAKCFHCGKPATTTALWGRSY